MLNFDILRRPMCLLFPSKRTLIDGIELPATNMTAPATPAMPKLPGQPDHRTDHRNLLAKLDLRVNL
jgi:hypothetical protein